MSDLGAERDQLNNENNELDQQIADLSLQKNMVNSRMKILFSTFLFLDDNNIE